MAVLIDSYSETNYSATIDLGDISNHAVGQAIALPFGFKYSLTSAKFYLERNGLCTGNCYAKIYAVTGTVGTDGKPTGAVLATSDAVDSSGIATGFHLVEFTFSTPLAVSAGNYCIEFYFSGGDYAGGKYLGGGTDDTTPTHAGNYYYRNASETATSSSVTDTIFYLYGDKTALGGSFLFNMV